MNTWKIILAALVIFGAGVVTGGLLVSHTLRTANAAAVAGAATNAPATPWQAQDHELIRRMDRELRLSRAQRERIEKIITESQDRTKTLWKPITPQMAAERLTVRENIREELTPDQRKRFDTLTKRAHHNAEAARKAAAVAGTNAPATNAPAVGLSTNTAPPAPLELNPTNFPALKPEPKRL